MRPGFGQKQGGTMLNWFLSHAPPRGGHLTIVLGLLMLLPAGGGCLRMSTARSTWLPGSHTEVAMEVAMARPFVEVHLNGSGPYRFLLDSGSSLMSIPEDVAAELGLVPFRSELLRIDSGMARSWHQVRLVKLDSIRLGTLELREVDAIVEKGAAGGVGILPTGLMRDYRLTLDYPAGRLRVDRDTLLGSEAAVSYRLRAGVPCQTIRLQGKPYPCILDTGLEGALLLPDKEAERLEFVDPPTAFGAARTINFEGLVRAGRLAGQLELGTHEVLEPIAFLGSGTPVLGGAILQHFVVTIDASNRLIEFLRAGEGAVRQPALVGFGFWSREDVSGSLRVAGVLPGSFADRHGLAEGDRIIHQTSATRPFRGENGQTLSVPILEVTYISEATGQKQTVRLPAEVIVP